MNQLFAGVPALVVAATVAVLFAAGAVAAAMSLRQRKRGFDPHWAFALFPLLQVALLFIDYWIVVRYCGADQVLLAACIVLAVLCLAVSGLALIAVVQVRSRQRDDARAEALRDQLDAYLAEYEETVANMESIARLRHDLRNQVQVVRVLAERGEFDLAQRHIAAMRKELYK